MTCAALYGAAPLGGVGVTVVSPAPGRLAARPGSSLAPMAVRTSTGPLRRVHRHARRADPRRAGSPPPAGLGPGHQPAAPFWRIPAAPDVDQLLLILGAQRLGLQLAEICELLIVRDTGACACEPARGLLQRHVTEISKDVERPVALGRAARHARGHAGPGCPGRLGHGLALTSGGSRQFVPGIRGGVTSDAIFHPAFSGRRSAHGSWFQALARRTAAGCPRTREVSLWRTAAGAGPGPGR